MELVTLLITDQNGQVLPLEIPLGINLSLMEALKASEYDLQATCGGMALCATCHVNITMGGELLPEPGDEELEILDSLPVLKPGSRLSCQIRINQSVDGLELEIIG